MKKNIILLSFFFLYSLVKGQHINDKGLYDSIGNRIKHDLDYEALEKLDCKNSGLRLVLLQFEMNKDGRINNLHILNDSTSNLLPYFLRVFEKPFRLAHKFKHYKEKVFLQPVFYSFPYCTKDQKKVDNQSGNKNLSISDTELKQEFQFQLKSIIGSLLNLFGNGEKAMYMEKILILPSVTVDGNISKGFKK